MKEPSEIAHIMKVEMNADSASTDTYNTVNVGTTRYRYNIMFTEPVTLKRIQDKLLRIEEEEGLRFKVVSLNPRIQQTETSIEAAFVVRIVETQSRAEIENEDLNNFTN